MILIGIIINSKHMHESHGTLHLVSTSITTW